MKIGVTGTREGANDDQLLRVISFMESLGTGHELHHGDCTGVDIQIAAVAKQLGWRIVCHPPRMTETQGYFGGDEVREPLGYLQRDRNIVDQTELLLVVPLQNKWQPKGGTWYTHDYAVKKGKTVEVFYPGEEK
jgi:hypothetical protein